MSPLLRKPLPFVGVATVGFVAVTAFIWRRISSDPPSSYQLGFPGWLAIHRDDRGWSVQGVDTLSLAIQIAMAIVVTSIVAKAINWKPTLAQPGERSLRSITIGLRVQAVSIFVLIGLWHFVLLTNLRQGENTSVLFVGLLVLLPLLSMILAFIVLETRIRYRERGPWWAYSSLFVAFIPWVWAMWAMSAKLSD